MTQRFLVVGAHPDDAELYAGGTVASVLADGGAVEFLILTDGRLGSRDPAAAHAQVAAMRAREAEAAAAFLGVASLREAGFHDGVLERSAAEAAAVVARAIRAFAPTVLVGHDPWRAYELHPDHRAAGFATCDGMIAARELHALPADAGPPHRPREVWLMGTSAPDHFVDISKVLDRKLDALARHASQFGHIDGWRERVQRWNERIGAERGCGAAEAFHRLAPAP